MTNAEYRKILEENGVSAADIKKIQDKFDAEKITETVENASNPQEAFTALHDLYPELEIDELKKQCDFLMAQIALTVEEAKKKGPMELTTEELDSVAGGGVFSDIGNWFKNNWKTILVGAAVIVACAAASALMIGAGGALFAGIDAVLTGADTFLGGAAFGASVGASGGAIMGGMCGVVADIAGAAKGFVDQYWS